MASNTPQYVCRNCGFSLPNPGATCARCGVNNSAYGNYYNNTQYSNNPYQYPNQYENQANLGTYVVPPPQGNIPVPPPPITVGFQSNQSNKIAMMAKGNVIEGYLNGKKLSSKQDNAFLDKGLVGLVAIDNGQSTEVNFNNAKVWSFSS